MKIAVAVLFVIAAVLGWLVFSTGEALRRQEAQIHELTTLVAGQTQGHSFALQRECAEGAHRFLVSRGWKAGDGSDYQNHFNERLSRCFVLVSAYLPNDDSRTIDLYDAIEGKRYATYNGHNTCDEAIARNPRKCAMDSGSIWFDGNDSRLPADFTVGFRGLLYGGGAGDKNTQRIFLERVRAFIGQ